MYSFFSQDAKINYIQLKIKRHVDRYCKVGQNTFTLDKTNECALSEDSDQPKHPSNLIRVFTVRSDGK